MRFAAAALSLLALRLVAAAEIHVTVGGVEGGSPVLLFNPEATYANLGDTVIFTFKAKNHTLTQGSFDGPCTPLPGGFDSGFKPVAADATEFPTVQYTVTDASKPLWFHCAQPGHCGKGMVFSINCPADGPNSFANFKKSALAIGAAQGGGAAPPATGTTTVYGTYTVPPDPTGQTVTATISLQSSVWTTTYMSYDGTGDPTPSALEGVVHDVSVGKGGLIFDPPFVPASPRDTIRFTFYAKNHTVTQSSFSNPCKKLEVSATTGLPGLDSGFMPVAADATTNPTWEVKVNTTEALWFYCQQPVGNHCGSGMVFAVNPDEKSARNFAAYQALAKTINGTSAAANQPSGTGRPGSDAAKRIALGPSAAALGLIAGAAALFL